MLQKALGDALEQTDFFLSDDDVAEVVDTGDDYEHGAITASPPKAQIAQHLGKKGHHHQIAATTPRPPRGSLGSLASTASGMGLAAADQSSLWTEDGLSVSVDSGNDDVDMA
jgi:hypothetical protein